MSELRNSPSPSPSPSSSSSSSTDETAAAAAATAAPLSFDIVWSVWTGRQGNGIRADDYNRYRQYCSRRLRRLRRAHDNQLHNNAYKKNKSSSSSSSSSSSTQGVGKSRVVDVPRVVDGVVLAVPLFLSERAWAHAVALQQEVTNGAPARRNVHRIKRLATAVRYATTLLEVAALRFDARTQLEAAAYHLTLKGYHALATRNFQLAAQHFQQALDVYERLSPISSPSVSEVCQAHVEELTAARRLAEHQHKVSMQVQPSSSSSSSSFSSALKLCPAASTLLSSLSVELESLVLSSQTSQSLNAVEWLGRDIPVTDDKLKQLLRDAKQLQQQLDQINQHDDATLHTAVNTSPPSTSSTSASSSSSSSSSSSAPSSSSVFSLLMNTYASCLSVIKSELSELKAETTKRHLILLQQFVTHQRLTATYQRNMRTALSMHLRYQHQLHPSSSSSSYPTITSTTSSSSSSSSSFSSSPAMKKVRALDLVGVYSRLQHNMLELGELAKTTGAPQLKAQAELLSSIFAGARCFFVADAYERQGNFSEAAALFQRAHDKSKAALDSLLPLSVPDKELLVPQVAPLIEKSVQRMIVCQANSIIQQQRQQQQADSTSPQLLPPSSPSSSLLHDALSPAASSSPSSLSSSSSSSSSSVLPSISFPPPVSAMTVKPIMFDLASQLIAYPDLSKRFASKSSQPSRPPQPQLQSQPPQQQPSPPPQHSPSNEDASKQGQKGFFGWFRR